MTHARLSNAAVVACTIALVALTGCFSAPVPMTAVHHDQPSGARCLLVLLPGVGDDADDFRKKGFVETIRKSGISADIIATNATLGYYLKGKMPQQLFADVILPAQTARHYEQTWLVGISMGGLGTLLGAQHHGTELAGIIALAPYVGRDKTLDSIRHAGGLDGWVPPPKATPTGDNYDAQLWRWLKAAVNGQEPAPSIYLGWGSDDRLGKDDVLLAAKLPKDHVFVTNGGHDWEPWNRLLSRILRETSLAEACKSAR